MLYFLSDKFQMCKSEFVKGVSVDGGGQLIG